MQIQEKSLDELVKKYYEGNPSQGSGSGTLPASRDDIVNFVNQKGVPNDQPQSTTEQDPDVSATVEPLEQAQDPNSAEAGLDQVLDEQAPGTVEPTPAGDGTGAGNAGDSGEPATSSAGGEGDHGAAGVPANDAEVEQQPAPSEQTGTDTQGGEEGSTQTGEESVPQGGAEQGSEPEPVEGETPTEGAEQTPTQEEGGEQSSTQEDQPQSNETESTQNGGQEGGSETQEVTPAEPVDGEDSVDSGNTDPAMDDPLGVDEGEETQTPEQEQEEVEAGTDAAQAVAVAAGTPEAAPDPESAVTHTEGEEASTTDTSNEEGESTSTETPAPSDEGEALAPEIGTFDTAEKVLEVNPSHEVLNQQDSQSDSQVIKKAYGLNSRLGDYARIITDRFPNNEAQTKEVSQESITFRKISRIGLEALIENGKDLLGDAFDPGEDNPVQEAIIQSKDNVLTCLGSSLKDLELMFNVTNDITNRSQAIIDEHDEHEGKNVSETAYRVFTSLSVNNKIEFGGFGCSSVLNNVLGDIKNWLASDYYKLLSSLERTQEGSIGALVLASLPELTQAEELKSEGDQGIVTTRRSETLPGEACIEQRKRADGSVEAMFGFSGVDPFDAEKPQTVIVPSKIEVQTLLNELNNAVVTANGYKDLVTRLEASVQAFYAWYADADPDQVTIEGADNFVSGLNFVSTFGAYLTNYIQSLSAYILLKSE